MVATPAEKKMSPLTGLILIIGVAALALGGAHIHATSGGSAAAPPPSGGKPCSGKPSDHLLRQFTAGTKTVNLRCGKGGWRHIVRNHPGKPHIVMDCIEKVLAHDSMTFDAAHGTEVWSWAWGTGARSVAKVIVNPQTGNIVTAWPSGGNSLNGSWYDCAEA